MLDHVDHRSPIFPQTMQKVLAETGFHLIDFLSCPDALYTEGRKFIMQAGKAELKSPQDRGQYFSSQVS